MTVKFQFDKDASGERRIIITKEGGFDPNKMMEVIDVVEKMFDDDSEEDQEIDLAEAPATDGRGKPAGELPDGTKIRHDGQVDGRSIRGAAAATPENDAAKQSFADRLKKAAPAVKGKAQEK